MYACTWLFLRTAVSWPLSQGPTSAPVLGAASSLLCVECMFLPGAPTLPGACLVHRSYGNTPLTPPPAGPVASCLCSFSFLSCSLTLGGEGATPLVGLPPSLLLPVPCGTLLWGQVPPFCPFTIVLILNLSWECPLCYLHNE